MTITELVKRLQIYSEEMNVVVITNEGRHFLADYFEVEKNDDNSNNLLLHVEEQE